MTANIQAMQGRGADVAAKVIVMPILSNEAKGR